MESHEITLAGKTLPIKAVRNITGHNILRYRIHGSKQVPFVKTKTTQRMEEGDVFAIETFGTTGTAVLRDDIGVYGYARNEHANTAGLHHASAHALLRTIDQNFGTLVFARRQLERIPGVKSYHLGMRSLVNSGIVDAYAPLVDVPGSYVAQFEHVSGRIERVPFPPPPFLFYLFCNGSNISSLYRLSCCARIARKLYRVAMTTKHALGNMSVMRC